MKKVVLINQSSGYLMVDIVNAYSEKYDEVVFISSGINPKERRLKPGIKESHIVRYDRSSSAKRILTWGIAMVQIFLKLLFRYQGYHIVYVTNPPISYFCSRFIRNPFSIIVFDIYPDSLKNIGIDTKSFIYKYLSKINRKLFARAEKIYALSSGMASALSAYVPISQVKVIPLWPISQSFSPVPKEENPFVIKNGLQDKFIVLYSGNMGYTHSVDVLLDVASCLQKETGIHFLLIGGGKKKAELERRVNNESLKNCTILDWQALEILPFSMAAADVGVVTLNEKSSQASVPSKTFNLMAVGAPLLGIASSESELQNLIDKYHNGACYPPGEIIAMVKFIENLYTDKAYQRKMSENSIHAARHFTIANANLFVD